MKLILAPMAGYSDQPFRRLCRIFGADETVTELISANALVRDSAKTIKMAEIDDGERPASVQIFGNDPTIMAEAAERVQKLQPLFIDINMGCPAKKVVKNGAGSALLGHHRLVGKIVRAISERVKTPVSVKIRTGKNIGETDLGMDMAMAAIENGATRVTVHGRTVAEKFAGSIDFGFIKKLKMMAGQGIEIIGNGGINSLEDAEFMMQKTGVDGLMIGRGAIGRPSIFKAIHDGVECRATEEVDTMLTHIDWMEQYYGRHGVGPMRGHLMYYSRGHMSAREFRTRISVAESFDKIREVVTELFGAEVKTYR